MESISARDRMRNWREKKIADGGRYISVMLSPKSLQMLMEIQRSIENRKERKLTLLINRAIESFHREIAHRK